MAVISETNKRIAKNTAYLYTRTIVILLISLYTSRVILKALGVEDFGIYNVVAGIIAMFTFISASMQSATQRYLSYSLGQNDTKGYNAVFNNSIILYFIITVALVVLAETVGLWYVREKLNIGTSSLSRVVYVYQISICTTIVLLFRIPYMAGIISQEKMSFFAINSVLEAILKLAVVYLLVISDNDKLITYAWLLLCSHIIINLIYMVKCRYGDRELYHLNFKVERGIFRQMANFLGWRTMGAFSQTAEKQGTNLILNLFWSAVVNAAYAIANQVYVAVYSLLSGFQQSFIPAITKSYAAKDVAGLKSLLLFSSKISFILISFCALPIITNMDFLLDIWLVEVPKYAASFCTILIINLTIDAYSTPLYTIILATGRIATYQIVLSLVVLAGLGLSIIFAYSGFSPIIVLLPKIISTTVLLVYRIWWVSAKIGISGANYSWRVIILPVGMLAVLLLAFHWLSFAVAAVSLLIISIVFTLIVYPVLVYFVVLSKNEKNRVRDYLMVKLKIARN